MIPFPLEAAAWFGAIRVLVPALLNEALADLPSQALDVVVLNPEAFQPADGKEEIALKFWLKLIWAQAEQKLKNNTAKNKYLFISGG